jgi:hypothetical protein
MVIIIIMFCGGFFERASFVTSDSPGSSGCLGGWLCRYRRRELSGSGNGYLKYFLGERASLLISDRTGLSQRCSVGLGCEGGLLIWDLGSNPSLLSGWGRISDSTMLIKFLLVDWVLCIVY